jgi:alpha-ketoglutarate-dependent taurine dioxygenase
MIHHIRVHADDRQPGAQLAAALHADGVATFDGVADRDALLGLARRIMHVWQHRDSDSDGITTIRDRGDLAHQPGFAGFGHDELTVHTEASTVEDPPQLMMLFCAQPATSGGQCRLVDGARLHHELAARDPDLLAELSTPRSALFGGSTGHLGAVFDDRNGRTVVRLRLDDLVQFSPQITRRLPNLRALLRGFEISIRLARGNGYLLCNTRWLHGRTAFTGQRLMYRLLGSPLATVQIPPGFPRGRGGPGAAQSSRCNPLGFGQHEMRVS